MHRLADQRQGLRRRLRKAGRLQARQLQRLDLLCACAHGLPQPAASGCGGLPQLQRQWLANSSSTCCYACKWLEPRLMCLQAGAAAVNGRCSSSASMCSWCWCSSAALLQLNATNTQQPAGRPCWRATILERGHQRLLHCCGVEGYSTACKACVLCGLCWRHECFADAGSPAASSALLLFS
ncbi:hypothetical protein COO60DRAFT_1285845 [Scenedesmus sp. NREL 46B-D3]|nr:hypothetical protein COO60DRAFT_1285845 [Scenedesmus sp. NREL 46B-D3]